MGTEDCNCEAHRLARQQSPGQGGRAELPAEFSAARTTDKPTLRQRDYLVKIQRSGQHLLGPAARYRGSTGSDRPDLRFGLRFVEVTDLFSQTNYSIFRQILQRGGVSGHAQCHAPVTLVALIAS